MNIKEVWEKHHEDNFLKFESVSNKASSRPDLHAFMLLDKLVPNENEQDMVCSAEHDEIWLNIDLEKLEKVVTEDQIVELIRCGVRLDTETDSLAMFV